MSPALTFIFVSAAVLGIAIACLVFFANLQRSESRLTRLTSLALAFVLAGLLFGGNKFVGYSLIGIGALFAFTEMLSKARRA